MLCVYLAKGDLSFDVVIMVSSWIWLVSVSVCALQDYEANRCKEPDARIFKKNLLGLGLAGGILAGFGPVLPIVGFVFWWRAYRKRKSYQRQCAIRRASNLERLKDTFEDGWYIAKRTFPHTKFAAMQLNEAGEEISPSQTREFYSFEEARNFISSKTGATNRKAD